MYLGATRVVGLYRGTTPVVSWLGANPICASIRNFGGIGDGVADDTAAFVALVTYCAATGASGYLPAGTYLVDPSSRTFTSPVPFTIFGDGVTSVLKSRGSAGFIGWVGANGVGFENLTIDASFTGTPVAGSGGTLSLSNSSNNVIRDVTFTNVYRVAVQIYNDHQTTLANVYGGHLLERVTVTGPANKVNNTGPSAILLADVDDSTIKDCSISNIGQYGYEFKNDCNRCLITGCTATNSYKSFYFGGDGAHTELGYVKDSVISNCLSIDSEQPVYLGLASGNSVTNVRSETTTDGPAPSRAICSLGVQSSNNTISGLTIVNRKGRAVDIRDASPNNSVSFHLEDGAYTTNKYLINADSTGNTVTEV